MINDISEHEIREVLGQIKHSAIDCTLVELGIIKDFELKGKRIAVTFAFPFANIPIKDYIIMSVKFPLEKMGLIVEVKTTVMNQDEVERFLDLEEKYWRSMP